MRVHLAIPWSARKGKSAEWLSSQILSAIEQLGGTRVGNVDPVGTLVDLPSALDLKDCKEALGRGFLVEQTIVHCPHCWKAGQLCCCGETPCITCSDEFHRSCEKSKL